MKTNWDHHIDRDILAELEDLHGSSPSANRQKDQSGSHNNILNSSARSREQRLVSNGRSVVSNQQTARQKGAQYKEKVSNKQCENPTKGTRQRAQRKRSSSQDSSSQQSVLEKSQVSYRGNRINPKDYTIETWYPSPEQGSHVLHITTANNTKQTVKQIKELLRDFNWILIQAFDSAIPTALEIVEQAIASMNLQLYRINIPRMVKAQERWQSRFSDFESFVKTLEFPELRIQLSLKPLLARHMGYQHYRPKAVSDQYNRKPRYRIKD